VRRLEHSTTWWKPIQFDPKGHYVAYGIREPNVVENENRVDLYVKRIDSQLDTPPRRLFSGSGISQLHWLADGRQTLALVKRGNRSVIELIDAQSSKHLPLVEQPHDIKEFSVDQTGRVIAFDTEEFEADTAGRDDTEEDAERGFRIPFAVTGNPGVKRRLVFITRRTTRGSWTVPTRVILRGPLDGVKLDAFQGVDNHGDLNLSLSPDGERLILSYQSAAAIPHAWMENEGVAQTLHAGMLISLTVMVTLNTNTSTIAIQSPWTVGVPFWSSDSRFFALLSSSPIGSQWEREEASRHATFVESVHTFVVDSQSLQPSLVKIPALPDPTFDEPLSFDNGILMLHAAKDVIVRVSLQRGQWVAETPITLPLEGDHGYSVLGTNGRFVVGSYESPTIPPELYRYDLRTHTLHTLAKINPGFDDVELAHTERISWETAQHYRIEGMLIKPPDFKIGQRYPLVIQTQPGGSEFVCDAGPYGYPSFIPLPLADAEILYLYRTVPAGYSASSDKPHFLPGYPGDIGEAALQTEIWDSAVDQLSREGIVDLNRVGIIGYSRTGWYTEFALAHGRTHYRAASVADNVQYSLGEYWLSRRPFGMHAFEEMYGGSPYGDDLKSWLDYSISFNLGKIHTPLLMEQMGYGIQYSSSAAIPVPLASVFEVFDGLNALHQPVELYYYPNETHQMDHPKARFENLERNLDWFRFWLQGYERPRPQDPEQYVRWRGFRSAPNAGTH
jgi:dipeptidyl aminopeptidase/acylaminoacyl peptidase